MKNIDGRSERADGRERPAAGGGAFNGRGGKPSKVRQRNYHHAWYFEVRLLVPVVVIFRRQQ